MQGQARHFACCYRFELVPGSGHFLQRDSRRRSPSLSWTGSPGNSRYRHAGMIISGRQRQNWHTCAPARPAAVRATGTKIR